MKSMNEKFAQALSLYTDRRRIELLTARNNKEAIINEIVGLTNESEAGKKLLAKQIALWANRYKLSGTDLHALLKKHEDPKIRNFTAFVKWSIKDHLEAT